MKTVHLYQPSDKEYGDVCEFAQKAYTKDLSIHISRFPELFFTIRDNDALIGCMGLNKKLSFNLFLNDMRAKRMFATYASETTIGEQSVFAIKGFSAGVIILISLVAEYAFYNGIDKIAYAAINVSRKTIFRLGFHVDECGEVDLNVLSPEEQENYSRWYHTHTPVLSILDTALAPEVSRTIPHQICERALLSGKLAHYMATERARVQQKKLHNYIQHNHKTHQS